MRITIENTERIVEVAAAHSTEGVPARVWRGRTESGIEVECLVTRIAVPNEADNSQFERELMETPAPAADAPRAFPLRMIL